MIAMTIDLDHLSLAAVRSRGALAGRPVAVLGLARSGVALARFLVDAGAEVTIYDGRPAERARGRHRPARRPAGPPPGWVPVGSRRGAPGHGPDDDVAGDLARLPDDRAAPPGALSRSSSRLARPAIRGLAPHRVRDRPLPAPLPGAHDRGDRHEGQDHHLGPDRPPPGRRSQPSRRSSAATSAGRSSSASSTLRPDDRVVVELSELQLPTLSRGTTVAVYTNVTSDHLDRHGSLAAYRRVKRRLAELVDPAGALVLNADDPTVAAYAGLGTRTGRALPARAADERRRSGSSTAGSSPRASSAWRSPGAGSPRPGRAAGSCRSPSSTCPAATTSRTRWPRSAWPS